MIYICDKVFKNERKKKIVEDCLEKALFGSFLNILSNIFTHIKDVSFFIGDYSSIKRSLKETI